MNDEAMNKDIATTEQNRVGFPDIARSNRVYRPLTDIVEQGDHVTLMLEMPGVAPEDVDITLESRVLTVRGEVAQDGPEKLQLAYREYDEGDYERAFTVSEDFDPDKIAAEMQNGILSVRLPRSEAAKPKKIAVKSA